MLAAEELSKMYDDVINMNYGNPDLITDDIIISEALKDAREGHTKYTESRGDPALREEISKFYKEEHDINVADGEIIVTTGGNVAMFMALEAITDEGDEVIVHTPSYTTYIQQIELARGVPVMLPTYEEKNFEVDPEALVGLITPRTKSIIINTPTNPTGACFSKETLMGIAKAAIEHDLIVIADDIYSLYSFEQPFFPIAALPGMKDRTIIINSFSKDYVMAGWRVGSIIAPENIVTTLRLINENLVAIAPSVSQRAAIHALQSRGRIQAKYREEYKNRVLYAAERVNNMKNISAMPPKGTFYLFANIKKTGLTSEQAASLILKEAHVCVLPGNAFGDGGEGYVRFSCVHEMKKLKEAFDRIAAMAIFQ